MEMRPFRRRVLQSKEKEVEIGIDPFAFVEQFNYYEKIEPVAEDADQKKIDDYAKRVEYVQKKRHERNMKVRKTLRQILRQRPEFRIQEIKMRLGLNKKTNQVDSILKEHKRYILKKKNMEEDNASESSIDSLINSILEVRKDTSDGDKKRINKRINYSLDLK